MHFNKGATLVKMLGVFKTQHAYIIIIGVTVSSSSSSGWALWLSFACEFAVANTSIAVFVEFIKNLLSFLVSDEVSS